MTNLVLIEPAPPANRQRLTEADKESLRLAMERLEHTSLATKLTGLLGRQMVFLGQFVPSRVSQAVNKAAEKAIQSALRLAIRTVREDKPARDSRRAHKTAVVLAGAAGGAFGLSSLAFELPVSTTLMLRSIAEIARREGEDPQDPHTALACLEVFALGNDPRRNASGDQGEDNPRPEILESGYFAARGILAKSISEAASYIIGRGASDGSAPILVRLVAQIGSRFGIVVSQKLAAQTMPVIGALGGAAVNYAFADHFQAIAWGHFTIRRLERTYGPGLVRAEYDAMLQRAAA